MRKNLYLLIINALFIITLFQFGKGQLTLDSSVRSIYLLIFMMSVYIIERDKHRDEERAKEKKEQAYQNSYRNPNEYR